VLDLDAKALALKARALQALVPEFLPSTVLRACPELLDVQASSSSRGRVPRHALKGRTHGAHSPPPCAARH
jgi:hypothetical protein